MEIELISENRILKKKYQHLKRKERYLKVINAFATSLLIQQTVEEIVWDIAKNTIAKMHYVDCVIYLVDEAGEYLVQRAAHGPKNPIALDIYNPIKIKIGEGIVGTVAQTGIAEMIEDTSQDPRYILDDCARFSEIAVPIISSTHQVLGVIDSEHPKKCFFTKEDKDILITIASIAATKIVQAKAQEALQRSNHNLEQFAYIASHDLQEPLRMIISYAQLLEKGYKHAFDERGRTFLNYMVEGAKRMRTLINDVLDYSKISNTSTKVFHEVDCNEVLEVVLKNLDYTIQETHATIQYDKLPIIKGEFAQLIQLFQNLIGNAIKFRTPQQIPKIDIFVEEIFPFYKIGIKDNGIGIAPDFQHQVFSIFKRLHSRRRYEGTGIGLAICKNIVENLGGKIWVESKKGEGATFYFTIPV